MANPEEVSRHLMTVYRALIKRRNNGLPQEDGRAVLNFRKPPAKQVARETGLSEWLVKQVLTELARPGVEVLKAEYVKGARGKRRYLLQPGLRSIKQLSGNSEPVDPALKPEPRPPTADPGEPAGRVETHRLALDRVEAEVGALLQRHAELEVKVEEQRETIRSLEYQLRSERQLNQYYRAALDSLGLPTGLQQLIQGP